MSQPTRNEPSIAETLLAGMFGMEEGQIARNREQQPNFWAEMRSEFRGGREDLWNAVIPAFPDSMQVTREMGEPGSPTPQIVTEGLTDKGVDLNTDTIADTLLARDATHREAVHGRNEAQQDIRLYQPERSMNDREM